MSKFLKYFFFALMGIPAVIYLLGRFYILIVNYSAINYETAHSWSVDDWFQTIPQYSRVTNDGRVILRKVNDERIYYACLDDENHLRMTAQWYVECEPGTAVDVSRKKDEELEYLSCNKSPHTDSTYLWTSRYWPKSPMDVSWSFDYGGFSAYPGFSRWSYQEAIRANTLRQAFIPSNEPKIPKEKPEDNQSDSNWSFEKDGITDEIVQEAHRISEEIRHYRKGSASDTELCVND